MWIIFYSVHPVKKTGIFMVFAFLISFRVSCEDDVISKFFSGYDKALRPGFGKQSILNLVVYHTGDTIKYTGDITQYVGY